MRPDVSTIAHEIREETDEYSHGIRANLGQFSQQLLQVFFVGLTIGLQRNVIPALAEQEFGILPWVVHPAHGVYRQLRLCQGCLPGEGHTEFESNAANPEKQVPIIQPASGLLRLAVRAGLEKCCSVLYVHPMLILSEKDVQSLLDIEELIQILEEAHVQLSTGKAVMPVRLVVPLPQIKGRLTSMPGYLCDSNALGMKVVTYFQENSNVGLPAILATITLYSPETGKPLVLMDGSYITAIRTACASAVATKALANPETPVLGILGAGVQARAHVRALSTVRRITRVKVYSPSGTSAKRLKADLEAETGIEIEPVGAAVEAVREVDLLTTVTTAKEPILNADWLKRGLHINAVGSHRPDIREIDPATIKLARIVVDSREAVRAECGDILMAIKAGEVTEDCIDAEIGEVLAGAKPGRSSADEITLYKSVGIALQDVATAHLVYQKALDRRVGVDVDVN